MENNADVIIIENDEEIYDYVMISDSDNEGTMNRKSSSLPRTTVQASSSPLSSRQLSLLPSVLSSLPIQSKRNADNTKEKVRKRKDSPHSSRSECQLRRSPDITNLFIYC